MNQENFKRAVADKRRLWCDGRIDTLAPVFILQHHLFRGPSRGLFLSRLSVYRPVLLCLALPCQSFRGGSAHTYFNVHVKRGYCFTHGAPIPTSQGRPCSSLPTQRTPLPMFSHATASALAAFIKHRHGVHHPSENRVPTEMNDEEVKRRVRASRDAVARTWTTKAPVGTAVKRR